MATGSPLDKKLYMFYLVKVMSKKEKLIIYVFTRNAGNFCRDGLYFYFS